MTHGTVNYPRHKKQTYDYHPKIRSETCPSIPLLGDCWSAPAAGCDGVGWMAATGVTGTPAPGRRNAEADGASLIGVPTVGVDGSTTRGVP